MNKYNLTKEEVVASLGYDDKTKEYILKHLIFLTVAGSHAYGLNTETSDIDIRGIFVADKNYVIGDERIEQYQNSTNDTVIYELKFALHLISEQNPNMLELLWIDEEDILYSTDEYWELRNHRKELLSSLVKQKFSGYAMSQLKRIKGHNRWLIKEKEGKFDKKPELLDYCRMIDADTGITYRNRDFLESACHRTFLTHETETVYKVWYIDQPATIENKWIGENYTFKCQEGKPKESIFQGLMFFSHDQFDMDMKEWSNWKKWKDNRNPLRHELEEKYGVDTKHVYHTIRLLRMGIEILEGKGVIVKRIEDREELMDMRNGKYTYDQILWQATDLDSKVIAKAYEETKLPRSINRELVNKLLIQIYELHWRK